MKKKKSPGIALTIAFVLLALAAMIGLGRFCAKMVKHCRKKCKETDCEPPAFCQWLMEKCAPSE